MNVTVKLFATLRQAAGWSERQVELGDGATVDTLLAKLAQDQPGLDLAGRAVYAAVNRSYVRADHSLTEGDIVALFPPVSGGCAPEPGKGALRPARGIF